MNTGWMRLTLAVLAGGIGSSLTDWLFMGDWIYKRYDRHPEIWRHSGGDGETQAILWASLLPFLTCAVFAFLCLRLDLHSYAATLKLALAIWLIGPLPLMIANALFVKLSPGIVISHSLGWLVKLCVAAMAVAVVMG
jgi:lysylphosphatidylglycerol synthetase-like protein (DUF2156 family)